MKNITDVNREAAKRLNMSEKDIELVGAFYDKACRNFKLKIKGVAYNDAGVGTFFISYPQLRATIKTILGKVREYRDPIKAERAPVRAVAILKNYEKLLKRLIVYRNILAIHKLKIAIYYLEKRKKYLLEHEQVLANNKASLEGIPQSPPPGVQESPTDSIITHHES